MTSFLDTPLFDFSVPAAQDLHELLWTNIDSQRAVRAVLNNAGVRPGLVHMEQPIYLVWHDVLEAAAKQGKVRALLDAVRRDPVTGAVLAPRLDELSLPAPPLQRPLGTTTFKWSGDEAFTSDTNTLLDVAFLALGSERARSVVRILASFDGSPTPSMGTGFLVRPNLVMSNHHVLYRDGEPACRVSAWFDYERTTRGTDAPFFEVAGDSGSILGDVACDCAIVRLETPVDRPALPIEQNRQPTAGDRVYIIQHPAGGPKKIGMVHNTVQHADAAVVQYLTDTLPGSSGAPVFNESWDVVALHHRSVMGKTAAGKDEIRNQGIRIDAAIKALTARGIL